MHRDIKPSNVLVTLHDGKPVRKVIDFGVAKALNTRLTERTIYTAHIQVIGTLMYIEPRASLRISSLPTRPQENRNGCSRASSTNLSYITSETVCQLLRAS